MTHAPVKILVHAFCLFFILSNVPVNAKTITVVGTGDGLHVLELLANEYAKANPGHGINLPPSVGSSGGIQLVGKKKNSLGRVARTLRDTEKQFGLSYIPYARIPVVLMVNPSAGVNDLTIDQVLKIYRGEVKDWRELGGNAGKIRAIRREGGDSSIEILNMTIPKFKSLKFSEFVKVATSESQNIALISSTPGAVGFGPLPDSAGPQVKILSLNKKLPSDLEYKLNLVLGLVFHATDQAENLEKFVNFTISENARSVIRDAGAIPY